MAASLDFSGRRLWFSLALLRMCSSLSGSSASCSAAPAGGCPVAVLAAKAD
jgi:hypothetical protein